VPTPSTADHTSSTRVEATWHVPARDRARQLCHAAPPAYGADNSPCLFAGTSRADDGTRTHDLLYGKRGVNRARRAEIRGWMRVPASSRTRRARAGFDRIRSDSGVFGHQFRTCAHSTRIEAEPSRSVTCRPKPQVDENADDGWRVYSTAWATYLCSAPSARVARATGTATDVAAPRSSAARAGGSPRLPPAPRRPSGAPGRARGSPAPRRCRRACSRSWSTAGRRPTKRPR
jgi:hypothetical protein